MQATGNALTNTAGAEAASGDVRLYQLLDLTKFWFGRRAHCSRLGERSRSVSPVKSAGNNPGETFPLKRETHMIMIKAIAIVFGVGAAAILLLEQVTPDTILAIVCCFA